MFNTKVGDEGGSHNRIMYGTTRDFREFSKPRVWIDRGWPTIDTTVIGRQGLYYRFVKDERSRGRKAPHGKSAFSETTYSLTAADWKPLAGASVLPVTAEEYARLSAAWGERVHSSVSQGSPGR